MEGSDVALEADELARAAAALPPAETLLTLARQRLTRELRALPPEGGVAWRAALLSETSQRRVSFGALAHGVRLEARSGRMAEAQDLFVALLRRIEGLNRRWLREALWSAPPSERRERAQDLAQELTLLLWEHLAQRDDEAWELFFQRALAYAQRHVAVAYLRREGLWADPRARQPERGLAIVFSRLAAEDDDAAAQAPSAPDMADFTGAELADLRALVRRLPTRERLAVVMRFWQGAGEAEIALALGGVSTRAVRYTLRRAYSRLRAWYDGDTEAEDDPAESAAPGEPADAEEARDVGE